MIIDDLVLGLLAMCVCLAVQALLVLWALHFYQKHYIAPAVRRPLRKLWLMLGVMVILVLGNIMQVAIWAQLFIVLDEFSDFRTALYHSAVNFATLGYGDIVMSERHRLLGPLEAINGVIMIGVSTAMMMTALQEALQAARQGLDADPVDSRLSGK